MMRASLLSVVVALACIASGCGLGAKESLADRVERAGDRLESSGTATGTLAVSVKVLKAEDDPVVPGPPKILPSSIEKIPVALDLAHASAAVGIRDGDPTTAVLVFRGSNLYQRIAPKTTSIGAAVLGNGASTIAPLASAASNLPPLAAAYVGATLGPAEPVATTSPSTATTVVHTALRRASRIPRKWVAFDFDGLDNDDSSTRAGSFAINPTVLLRLIHGVLTGSIERHGDRYDANVNRDKAERKLSEDERTVLDKIFRANAVSKRTFPAHIWLDRNGALARFEVRLRQHLTSVDRADLTVTIGLDRAGVPLHIGAPDRTTTATVATLGQLVTSVARS
jgi:hypothetical protein